MLGIISKSTGHPHFGSITELPCRCNDYKRLIRHVRPHVDLLAGNASRMGGGKQLQTTKQTAMAVNQITKQVKDFLKDLDPIEADEFLKEIDLEDMDGLELRVI